MDPATEKLILDCAKELWPTLKTMPGSRIAIDQDPTHTTYSIREFGRGLAIHVTTPYITAPMLAVDHEEAASSLLGMVLLLASRKKKQDGEDSTAANGIREI